MHRAEENSYVSMTHPCKHTYREKKHVSGSVEEPYRLPLKPKIKLYRITFINRSRLGDNQYGSPPLLFLFRVNLLHGRSPLKNEIRYFIIRFGDYGYCSAFPSFAF